MGTYMYNKVVEPHNLTLNIWCPNPYHVTVMDVEIDIILKLGLRAKLNDVCNIHDWHLMIIWLPCVVICLNFSTVYLLQNSWTTDILNPQLCDVPIHHVSMMQKMYIITDANPPHLIERLSIFANIFVHFDTQIWQPSYFWQALCLWSCM